MYLRCDGNLSYGSNTTPRCDAWVEIDPSELESTSIFEPLTIQEGIEISGAIILLWGTAYGAKMLVKFLGTMNMGRYG